MGKAIEQIALDRGHEIIDRSNSTSPLDIESIDGADVAIEFTNPDSAAQNIETCLTNNIPIVVGSTGWYEDFDRLSELCEDLMGSLFYATNFSLGVNLMFKLNEELAKLMNGRHQYKPEITEIHHTEKKDSPSGTAITLAENIISNYDVKTDWTNTKPSNESELEIKSERKPDVPGTHTVAYNSEIDSIEITHTAHNRMGFALGAVIAAEWLLDKKGVFTMKDILNA